MEREKLRLAALLLGAIGGVQIWAVTGLSTGLGLLNVLVWLLAAGTMAMAALFLLRCAALYPRVAGSYAYVRAANGHFYGFMTGWATLWAEALMLGILAILAADFIGLFIQLPIIGAIALKAVFITAVSVLTLLNGRKAPAIWSSVKIVLFFIFLAMAAVFATKNPGLLPLNWSPDWLAALPALAIAIWALSGFNIMTLPKLTDISDMRKVVATAFGTAVAVFIAFDVLVGAGAASASAAATAMFPVFGVVVVIVAAGAALSAFLSPTAARTPQICVLSRAMAADGMLPKIVVTRERNGVLLFPLIAQAIVAFIASITNNIPGLVYFAFVLLTIPLATVSIAYARLRRYYMRVPYETYTPVYSVAVLIFILLVALSQVPPSPLLSAIVILLLGIPFYIHLAPKTENAALKERVLTEEFTQTGYGVAKNAYMGALLGWFEKRKR